MLVSLSPSEKVKFVDGNEVRNVKFYRQSMKNRFFSLFRSITSSMPMLTFEGYSRFVELRIESAHLCPAKHTMLDAGRGV